MSQPVAHPIRVGISACLLGQKVRYDGGHKRDAYLVETFGRFVEWVPVCPEVETGLGTPRETLRLVRIGEEVRMVMPRTGADHTDAMRSHAERRLKELAQVSWFSVKWRVAVLGNLLSSAATRREFSRHGGLSFDEVRA